MHESHNLTKVYICAYFLNQGALGTCFGQKPLTSPVQYFLGEDLEIFILSPDGEKFKAIKENPNVCLLVNADYLSYKIKGVQVFGTAKTSIEDETLYDEAMMFLTDPNIIDIEMEELKVIKIVPQEIVYLDAFKDENRTKQIIENGHIRDKDEDILLY